MERLKAMLYFCNHKSFITLITSPLKHKRLMKTTCIALSVIIAWCIPIRVCIFTPVYLRSKATALKYLVPILMFLVVFEFVPCIVLPYLTFRMVYIVRKRRSPRINEDSSRELRSPIMRVHFREERSQRNHNISVVLFVAGLFVLCYSVDVYTCFCDVFNLSSISWQLWYARHLLLVTNSALNPLAYALFKRDIRQAILALGRVRSNNQVRPSTAN
ncbi:uncharacterized protein LOC144635413 [Oculina patagonica]